MTSTMTVVASLADEIKTDSDECVRAVGRLLLSFGFEPIAHNKSFPNLGEIDLGFKIQRDSFLVVLLVEASKESEEQNQKIDHFFSRWTNQENLALFLGPLGLNSAKAVRVYVDLSRDSGTAQLGSISHHLQTGSGNHVIFRDDMKYFEEMENIIGKWARSDLLSYLEVPRSQALISLHAIQFYLDSDPAFCFLCDVRTLLDACYISRRLGHQMGYQRALDKTRVGRIGREIQSGKIVAFPNSIIINCEKNLIQTLAPQNECPKHVEIALPTSYCSSIVVDGQHRLLGFSRIDEPLLSQRYLPVVAFQNLS